MTNVDSQRIKEIRDNTRAMAEAFGRIADALVEALELYVSTKTETQNSNLTFEKRTMRDCYNCKRYDTEDECIECRYEPKDEPQTYITEDRDTQILDAWQVHHRASTTAVEDEPQTEEHCETCRHKDECEGATYEYKNTEWWCLAYAPIDEPQTDCAWK